MKPNRLMWMVVLATVGAPLWTWAQVDTGAIVGTVRDQSGAVVSGVSVKATEEKTNIETRATSDSAGNYVIIPLKVGAYTVSVELAGFKPKSREGVVLRVQDRLRIDFDLDLGDAKDTIVVMGGEPLVQTETSSLGEVIDSRQIIDLPLNGRSFVDLTALTAGVERLGTGNNGNAGEDGTVVSNGARSSSNNFLLDGVDNNNNDSPGHLVVEPNVDAIEEFKVQTSNYSAEFGRAGGAVVNATLKSGSNLVSGTAFYFMRDEGLDARDYFAEPGSPRAPFGFHQFGGTIGGPIKKDSTFFFADFQGTKSTRSDTLTLSVPTEAMRRGDFSEEGNPTIYDPLTGAPFPGNVIPPSRMSPLAQAFASLYPNPNHEGLRNNYVVSPKVTDDTYQGDIRLDHQFSTSDRAFVRVSSSRASRFIPAPLPGLANGGDYGTGDTTRRIWGGALGYTKVFSPHSINDLRIGFNRLKTSVGVTPGGNRVPPPELRVRGVAVDDRIDGITNFAPDGYNFLGDPEYIPTYTLSQELQISDALTLIRGRHTLKLGVQARQSRFNLFQIPQPRGKFTFTGEFTQGHDDEHSGDSMADALLGLAAQTDIQNITDVENRTMVLGLFVQDDFKVSSSLTLNLGLRYDYTGPSIETKDRQSNFDFTTGRLLVANTDGNSRGLIEVDKLNVAPRVGFAWAPGGGDDWAVRGAYGLFYNNQEPRTAWQLGFNPPFFFTVSRFSDFGVTPAGHIEDGFPPVDPNDVHAPGIITVDRRFRSPYFQQWSLSVQRSLPWNAMLEVAYVGSKGSRLQVLRDLNQPAPAPGDVQERRPFHDYGNFASIQNLGRSRYDSLQIKLNKRFSHGLWLLSAFTYAKAKSDQGEIGLASPFPANSLDPDAEYGRSDADQRYRSVTSLAWDLPFGNGRRFLNKGGVLDAVFGGWRVGGIVTIASGFPFSPVISVDTSNTGTFGAVRPDQIGEGTLPADQRSVHRWFDVGAYRMPADYTFGNAKRNSLEGPGLQTVDLFLKKSFRLSERRSVELRLEAFNALNHPNFGAPDPAIDSGEAAGTITYLAIPMRELQLGVRYAF